MKVFAGLTLAVLALGGPPDSGAAPVEIKVSLDWDGSECVASVATSAYSLSHRQRDVPVWSFANNCPTEQKVHVCTTKTNPLSNCNGGADGGKINGDFRMKRDKYASVTCHIKWGLFQGHQDCTPSANCPKYPLAVVNGPADEDLDCPGTPLVVNASPSPTKRVTEPLGSELELETVP